MKNLVSNHALIFFAGFLSFALQLMETKKILPVLGGGVSIWVGALMFYQVFLLVSYLITYKITQSKKVGNYIKGVSILVPLSLLLSHFPIESSSPLLLLILKLLPFGLIYLLLLQISPLIQFFSKETNPYKYYASSNLGAALGLVAYPFWIENRINLSSQSIYWLFASVATILVSLFVLKKNKVSMDGVEIAPVHLKIPSYKNILFYSFIGTLFLGAYSSILSEDISGFPLLWMIPLFLYLLSFSIVFGPEKIKKLISPLESRKEKVLEAITLVQVACLFFIGSPWLIVIYSVSMFLFFLIIISNLSSLKKDEYTSSFYLLLAVGGAVGGIFNNLLPFFWKFGGDVVLFMVLFYIFYTQKHSLTLKNKIRNGIVAAAFLGIFIHAHFENFKDFVYVDRNFFGVVKVLDTNIGLEDQARVFISGRIIHGTQFYSYPNTATAYYQQQTGLGEAIDEKKSLKNSLVVGAIGEGAGVISTYFRETDSIDYFEINPLVIKISQKYFTFVTDSPARHEFIEGDGRVTLSKQNKTYDILVVDAFSGDAIPTHLLTKEAFELYFSKLSSDGSLLIHITNNFVDLAPVVEGALNAIGKKGTYIKKKVGDYETYWVEVSNKAPNYEGSKTVLWTDEKNQVLDVFSFSKFLMR